MLFTKWAQNICLGATFRVPSEGSTPMNSCQFFHNVERSDITDFYFGRLNNISVHYAIKTIYRHGRLNECLHDKGALIIKLHSLFSLGPYKVFHRT